MIFDEATVKSSCTTRIEHLLRILISAFIPRLPNHLIKENELYFPIILSAWERALSKCLI